MFQRRRSVTIHDRHFYKVLSSKGTSFCQQHCFLYHAFIMSLVFSYFKCHFNSH